VPPTARDRLSCIALRCPARALLPACRSVTLGVADRWTVTPTRRFRYWAPWCGLEGTTARVVGVGGGASTMTITPPLDVGQVACFCDYRAGRNVGVFGSAGCGKSVVLRAIIADARARYGDAAVGVCSWNGAAADLIGGETLHALFACGVYLGTPDSFLQALLARSWTVEKLRKLRVLVVDEVFTITAGSLAVFLRALRGIRPPALEVVPAGGVQVICTCRCSRLSV